LFKATDSAEFQATLDGCNSVLGSDGQIAAYSVTTAQVSETTISGP
jgi:hypothetical protein